MFIHDVSPGFGRLRELLLREAFGDALGDGVDQLIEECGVHAARSSGCPPAYAQLGGEASPRLGVEAGERVGGSSCLGDARPFAERSLSPTAARSGRER